MKSELVRPAARYTALSRWPLALCRVIESDGPAQCWHSLAPARRLKVIEGAGGGMRFSCLSYLAPPDFVADTVKEIDTDGWREQF